MRNDQGDESWASTKTNDEAVRLGARTGKKEQKSEGANYSLSLGRRRFTA